LRHDFDVKLSSRSCAVLSLVVSILMSACTANESSSTANVTPTNMTSPAPVTVEVPKLVGLSPDEAKSALKNVGLLMRVSKVATGPYPGPSVWSQAPSATSTVEVGSVVRVAIGPVRHG
jgi:beta-lactam-binding protein with PASTA domain